MEPMVRYVLLPTGHELLGNHDFDFGLEWLEEVTQQAVLFENTQKSSTCWVVSNLVVPGTDIPIAKAHKYVAFKSLTIQEGYNHSGWVQNWVGGS